MRSALLAACTVLTACSGGQPQVVNDLVAEVEVAEILQQTPLIDVGTPPARRWLAAGWYPDEGGDGAPDFAWSEGDASIIELPLVETGTVEARLRCRPLVPPGEERRTVNLELNGEAVASLELTDGFATYPLVLPSRWLRAGRNHLALHSAQPRSPRELGMGDDWRRLAVAVDWLRLAPGDPPSAPRGSAERATLAIPFGTSVRYHVRFVAGLSLELEGVRAMDHAAGRLRCNLSSDGGRSATVAEVSDGEGPIRVRLPGAVGEAVRLELQAVGVAGGIGDAGTLEVVRPRLTAVEPGHALETRPRTNETEGADTRPNIVIYLVDALRADRLGVYGQPLPLSPNLDEFAMRATVYERAWAQSSWTRPAVVSLFTGLRPEVHGVNGRLDRLGGGVVTLAERFADAGYSTAAVVANPNASATFGLDRGFEDFVLMPADRRRSADVHDEVVRWLDDHDASRPFLLYVHTVDPHLPYDPPARYRDRFARSVERRDLGSTEVVGTLLARDLVDEDRWKDDLLSLYDAEVASNDDAFGALLEALDRRGLSERSAVVFLSDHGEEFHDHGGWIHGRTLYREVLQVPLVIRYPGQREGRRVAATVSQVDLMPTLLELAGLDQEPGRHGSSLVGDLDRRRSAASFLDLDGWGGWSAVDGDRHAIRHRRLGYTGPAELYDLAGDPFEQCDLGGELGVTAGALVEESRRETLDEAGRYTVGPAAIDDDLRQRLEALGYL